MILELVSTITCEVVNDISTAEAPRIGGRMELAVGGITHFTGLVAVGAFCVVLLHGLGTYQEYMLWSRGA